MEHEDHSFNWKVVGIWYCTKCGLMALKNPMTEWSIRKGCKFREDPNFTATVAKLTSPFK